MAVPYRRQTEVMSMRPYEELRIPSANVKKTPRVRIVPPRIYTHAYHTLSTLVCTVKVRCLHKAKKTKYKHHNWANQRTSYTREEHTKSLFGFRNIP